MQCGFLRGYHDVVGQCLAKENDFGLKHAAALRANRKLPQPEECIQEGLTVAFPFTSEAMHLPQMPVDFQHPLRSRGLMQAIDVLGDDGRDDSQAFHFGQSEVGGVGAGLEDIRGQGLQPLIKSLRMIPKRPKTGDLEWVGETPQPGAIGTEVGNARGRGDARPCQYHDAFRAFQK